MFEKLKKSLAECPVVKMGDYQYFVHPLTDGVPYMEPELLREVLDAMKAIGNFDCDYIVAPEAMGIPLAVPLSLELGIPYNVIRKRQYNLPGEVNIAQCTGYSKKDMYINGIKKGDRVVIVDDVLSTGGTIHAIIDAMKNTIGADIVDVIVVLEKTKHKAEIERELGVKIKTLIKIEMVDGRPVCTD